MANHKQDQAVTNATVIMIIFIMIALAVGIIFESFLLGIITIGVGLYVALKSLAVSVAEESSNAAPYKERADGITISKNPKRKNVTFESRVAGAMHRCTDSDIGGFLGYIDPEPNNDYDKNAIAIYRNDGKHLGYIPKGDTARVRRWASRESLPCIGFILDGDEVAYWGRIVIVDADAKRTELEMVKCAIEMVERDGIDILPPEFRTEGDDQPKTKKEWLQVLQDYIAEHE